MNAGESMKGGTVERPRGRKQAEARRRTHRLAPGVIGFSLVMVFATFAFVVMPAPVHANPLKICEQCPNAPSQCEPNCGGGGGGTPLSLVLMGSPPSGVSATTGCVSNPGGMCIPQFSSSYSAPITSPSGTYYASTYTALASGGNGAYTYYWSYPGSNGWVAGSSVMSYEPKSVGSFTVSAEITESGFSSVSVGLSVSISAAPEPGGQSYSVRTRWMGPFAQPGRDAVGSQRPASRRRCRHPRQRYPGGDGHRRASGRHPHAIYRRDSRLCSVGWICEPGQRRLLRVGLGSARSFRRRKPGALGILG